MIHRHLIRHLARLNLGLESPPDQGQWRNLLDRLNRGYEDADRERYQLERSVSLSSTEMSQLNTRLRSERDQFARMFAAAPVGMMRIERDGLLSAANAALARITGREEAELGGLPFGELAAPEERERQGQVLAGLFEDRHDEAHGDARLIHRDGSPVYVKWGAVILRDEDGAAQQVLMVVEDVTDRNKLEIELRHAQKLESVGRLAAGVAHEINTPIQFVGDNLSFLDGAVTDLLGLVEHCRQLCQRARGAPLSDRDLASLAEAEEAADLDYLRENVGRSIAATKDGVKRVATIVQSMKSFAHPDRGQKTTANLNLALQSTLTVASNELKYVADVETDLGELPLVPCYLSDLNQVFLNLLVNAAHAIGDVVARRGGRGRIRVTSAVEGSEVVVTVSDTGDGIPAAIRDKIFEPFFTTKEVGKGTGQGLALARSVVVDKHGGSLTFRSEEGQGTTFYVRLPLPRDTAAAPLDPAASAGRGEAA